MDSRMGSIVDKLLEQVQRFSTALVFIVLSLQRVELFRRAAKPIVTNAITTKPIQRNKPVYGENPVVRDAFPSQKQVVIYFVSQAMTEKVKRQLMEQISTVVMSDSLEDEALERITDSEKNEINDLQVKFNVKITDETSTNGKRMYKFNGLTTNVLKAKSEAERIVSKFKCAETFSKTVTWGYVDPVSKQDEKFDVRSMLELETEFQTNKEGKLMIHTQNHGTIEVKFASGKAAFESGGHFFEVFRRENEHQEMNEGMTSSKPRSLRDVFGFQEMTHVELENSDHYAAFSAMKRTVELGSELNHARDLVKYYITAFRAKYREKAAEIRNELAQIIRDNLQTAADELIAFSKELQKQEKFMQAILFYQIASDFQLAATRDLESSEALKDCCRGIRDIAKIMIEKKSGMDSVVKKLILPLFDELKSTIKHSHSLEDELRITLIAWCFHCVEYILSYLGEHELREKTCRHALNMLEQKLPASYAKFYIYGVLTHNLGHTYMHQSRFSDAAEFFSKALTAYGSSTDFKSQNQKKAKIDLSERLLKEAVKEESLKITDLKFEY